MSPTELLDELAERSGLPAEDVAEALCHLGILLVTKPAPTFNALNHWVSAAAGFVGEHQAAEREEAT